MDALIIRRACDDADYRRFHALQLAYESELPADLRHPLAEAEHLPQVYAEPNAAFLALVGDAAAGCVASRRLDASTNVLQRLYVAPAYRSLGIARGLVDTVIATSRTAGYRRIVLDTDREQLRPAYALYCALGFSECDAYAPVDYAAPTYMELRLQ